MSHAVDFMRAPATPPAGWVLLLVGAIALSASFAISEDLGDVQAKLAAEAQAREDLARRQRTPVRAAEPSAADRRLQRAALDARTPWLATLRAIETTTESPVFLRSLTIDPAAGVVKLEAEAPAFGDAVAFAEALGKESMLRPALLTSHEVVVDPSSPTPVVRFAVAARWNRM